MDETTQHGGPAFPAPRNAAWGGMTMRDFFAAHALAGILAYPGEFPGAQTPEQSQAEGARIAYAYADAMLKARGGTP